MLSSMKPTPLFKSPRVAERRHLNIHEFQSKALMDKYGVNTQKWRLATNPTEAKKGAEELKAKELVVKAQIHAGGRGKGVFENGFKGGVQIASNAAEASDYASKMLGHRLITKQTHSSGVLVNKVMIAESLNFKKETYFAILMDRASQGPVMVASPQGGMDIEAVAHDTPHLIYKEAINIGKGVDPKQTKALAEKLGFKNVAQAQEQMSRLYDLFLATDATQVEINPLVETDDGKVYCVDAKINFDDNAAFRQKEIFGWRDTAEEDPREVAASKFDLNYIGMEGDIGCMVNGAGLAMATMDIIKLYNGSPANFLDVGGGANTSQITEAFKIISSDPQVKAILVNIFGGIMKCDIIANGIVQALSQVKIKQPVVVRLAGTNVELGQKILRESGFSLQTATDLDDAAQKAVAAIKK
jgi:succinyl-CoA synthetase beta subunit